MVLMRQKEEDEEEKEEGLKYSRQLIIRRSLFWKEQLGSLSEVIKAPRVAGKD